MVPRLKKSCEAAVEIDAPVDAVWGLVSDVTRTGEWSVECSGGDWLDGATGPAPGVRFRGRNKRNAARWSRICEVLEADAPHRLVWRTVPTRLFTDSTRWELELTPTGDGTTLTQRMQVLRIPAVYDVVFATLLPQHRDRTPDLEADLGRIKAALERASSASA